MQRIRTSLAFILITAVCALVLGCGKQPGNGKNNSRERDADPVVKRTAPAPRPTDAMPAVLQAEAFAQVDDAQRKYDAALLAAIDQLSQKKYAQALSSLEAAAKFKDTELVQVEIKKLRWRNEQHENAERTLRDIQTLVEQGKTIEASKLASAALQEFGLTDTAPALIQVKLQADTLAAAQMNDNGARQNTLRDEGQTAFDAGNLRVAALAFQQILQLGDDAQLRQRHGEIIAKLAKYDDLRQRAAELRKDPASLEDAIALMKRRCQTVGHAANPAGPGRLPIGPSVPPRPCRRCQFRSSRRRRHSSGRQRDCRGVVATFQKPIRPRRAQPDRQIDGGIATRSGPIR